MNLKIIPFILAALTLAGCSNNNTEPSTTSVPPTSSAPVEQWTYLDWMSGDKALRIDLFDIEEGVNFSYGNAALSQSVNNLTIDSNIKVTVNKNVEHEKDFNFIMVRDTKDGSRHVIDYNSKIEGDHIIDFLALDGNAITGCDRCYIAISMGTTPKWTKNLNAKMDADIEAYGSMK